MKKEYIAPESNVMEMNAEGVLCASDITSGTGKSTMESYTASDVNIWG